MADEISFKVFAPEGRLFDESYAVRVVGTEPVLNGTRSRVLSARVADGGQSLELTVESMVDRVAEIIESTDDRKAAFERTRDYLSTARHVHPGFGRQGGMAFASRRFPGAR